MCRGQPSAAPLTRTIISATILVPGTGQETGEVMMPTSSCGSTATSTSDVSTLVTPRTSSTRISSTPSSAVTTETSECQTTTSANLFEGPCASPTVCLDQPDQEEEELPSLSKGQIAAIALGSTAFVALFAAAVICARRRRKRILQNGQNRTSFFTIGHRNSSRQADSPELGVGFGEPTVQGMAHRNKDFRNPMFPRADVSAPRPALAADGVWGGLARNTTEGDIGLALSPSGTVMQPIPTTARRASRKEKTPFPRMPRDGRSGVSQRPPEADPPTQPRRIQDRRSLSSESGPTVILSTSSASTTASAGNASARKSKPLLTLKIPKCSTHLPSSEPGPLERPKQERETVQSSIIVTPFEEDGEGSMFESGPTRAKQILQPPLTVGTQRYYVADQNGNWRLGDPSSPQRMSQLVELEAPSLMTKSPIEIWEEEQNAAGLRAKQKMEVRRNKNQQQRDIVCSWTPVHQDGGAWAEGGYGRGQPNWALASRIKLEPTGRENRDRRSLSFCRQSDATPRPLQVSAAKSRPKIRQKSGTASRDPTTAHSFKQGWTPQEPQGQDNPSHSSSLRGSAIAIPSSEGLGILERNYDDPFMPRSTRTSQKLGWQNTHRSQAEAGWRNSNLGPSPVNESPVSSGGKSPVTYPKIPKPSMSPLAGHDRGAFDRLDMPADRINRMVKSSPRSIEMGKSMHKLPGQPDTTIGLTNPKGDEDGWGTLIQKSSTPDRQKNPTDQGNNPGGSVITARLPSQRGGEGRQRRQMPLCETHLESPPRWKGPPSEGSKPASRPKSPKSPKSSKSPNSFASPFVGSQSSTVTPGTSTGDEGASPGSPSCKQQKKEGGTASAQQRQPGPPHIAGTQSPTSTSMSVFTATPSPAPSSLLAKRVGENHAADLALGHEDATKGQGGSGESQPPLRSPLWVPELTPTRCGDDLFIDVQ